MSELKIEFKTRCKSLIDKGLDEKTASDITSLHMILERVLKLIMNNNKMLEYIIEEMDKSMKKIYE